MKILNIEIKARTTRAAEIRALLLEAGADYRGTDHQVDTYFRVPEGRLKLREGEIENSLIFYRRDNQAGPKSSHVRLAHVPSGSDLGGVLEAALGAWRTVDKMREIYFIDNVKFHLDKVRGLGEFVEIEAIDATGDIGQARLRAQCERFMDEFGIAPQDLLEQSYSDML